MDRRLRLKHQELYRHRQFELERDENILKGGAAKTPLILTLFAPPQLSEGELIELDRAIEDYEAASSNHLRPIDLSLITGGHHD